LINKYPYDISKNMKHYVLFSIKPLSLYEQKKILKKNFIENYEFISFINKRSNRSVKNLWHCHIFIKIY
jgi:hypothetical protein